MIKCFELAVSPVYCYAVNYKEGGVEFAQEVSNS